MSTIKNTIARRAVKATAKDLTNKPYEAQVAWK